MHPFVSRPAPTPPTLPLPLPLPPTPSLLHSPVTYVSNTAIAALQNFNHLPSSDRNSQGSMADSCGSGFEAHALAVFQRVNDGDIPGALAAARTWQQQLPCLLSSSLLQWLSSRATAAAASPAAADCAVYAEGASAFDLFASNGGNVCSHPAAAPKPPP
jgi:hypothetical protein